MRLGIITGEYPPMQGGVGDYSRELARAWVAQGHEVFVLTNRAATPPPNEPNIWVQPSVTHWGRWRSRGDRSPCGVVQAIAWVKKHQLEAVNIQYQAAAYNMHAAANDLPRRLRPHTTVITTFHDLRFPYLFPKAGPLRKRIVYQMARSSHGVVVTNHADGQELHQQGTMPPISQIPIGSNIAVAPPPAYDPVDWRTHRLHVPPEILLVGYFGFINASKGVDTLAQAVRMLVDRGTNVELLIIGGQTGASDATNIQQADIAERLIGGLGITQRVHWTGFVDESLVSAHLMACDIIALPYKDGVSLRRGTLMAALAHACPIVTTIPEAPIPELRQGHEAWLVPPDQPTALAEALLHLWYTPEIRERLRQGAGERSASFQWDTIARAVTDFIQHLRARA